MFIISAFRYYFSNNLFLVISAHYGAILKTKRKLEQWHVISAPFYYPSSRFQECQRLRDLGVCTSYFSPVDSAAGDQGRKKAHDVEFPSCHVCQKKLGFPGLNGGVNLNLETWAPVLAASECLHGVGSLSFPVCRVQWME